MYQVLIVDDEPFVRQGLKMIIDWDKYGFSISGEAKNGLEGYELLKKQKFDLVILDIRMPGMNGLELAAKIRETISKRLKIVLLSGFGEFQYAQEALKYNINHYLLKPIQPDELVKVLNEISGDLEKQKKAEKIHKDTVSVVGLHYLQEVLKGRESDKIMRGLERAFINQSELSYLHIELSQEDEIFTKMSSEEKVASFWKLYELILQYLDKFKGNCISNIGTNQLFEIGIVVSRQLLREKEFGDTGELEDAIMALSKEHFSYQMSCYSGDSVDNIRDIRSSYLSAMDNKANQSSSQDVELLSQIEREIRTNYQENLSLKELSDKYFINSAYLGQLFKKKYNIYFKDYLNYIRVERAKELLLHSSEKVYKISEKVGYNNVDYFINKFTKLVGVTPSKYRNQQLSQMNN